MDNNVRIWLYDILNALQEIDGFLEAEQYTFAAYQQDLRTKRAVERNIEIIGEALNRIFQCDETLLISHARKIVDTRNRIIHGYDSVSDEIIWSIVINHLPVLKIEIEVILGE
jgi:uncharacterized protein with HEPN domain